MFFKNNSGDSRRPLSEAELIRKFRPLKVSENNAFIPGPTAHFLRPYQKAGVRWMYSHVERDRGAILGDDMGLGKTVQVVALVSTVLQKTGFREQDAKQMDVKVREAREFRDAQLEAGRTGAAGVNQTTSSSDHAAATDNGVSLIVRLFVGWLVGWLETLFVLFLLPFVRPRLLSQMFALG